jgi:hypothetical protein
MSSKASALHPTGENILFPSDAERNGWVKLSYRHAVGASGVGEFTLVTPLQPPSPGTFPVTGAYLHRNPFQCVT